MSARGESWRVCRGRVSGRYALNGHVGVQIELPNVEHTSFTDNPLRL